MSARLKAQLVLSDAEREQLMGLTSASWLHQVERWFATLTQKYPRRGTHRSTRQLD